MIKAIIYDCYGVLTTDGWIPFKERHFGEDRGRFDEATELNRQTNAALLSYDDFLRTIGEMTNLSPEAVEQEIERNVANEALFDLIAEQKQHYKIGMLSNVAGDWLAKLFSPEQIALFDSTALSYQTGLIKPQPEAYFKAADLLGVEPEECIFVDDQERYVTVARELGMQGIVYRDFQQFKIELDDRLADSKN